MKILKNGAIIDFHINKDKYESYKTKSGRRNYVHRVLFKIFNSLTKKVVGRFEIREIDITSNNYWGNELCFINDIGYSNTNQLPMNEDVLTVRIFFVDIISVIVVEPVDHREHFMTIEGTGYKIYSGSYKII